MSSLSYEDRPSALTQHWHSLSAPARAQWQQMAPRERLAAQVGLGALALLLTWLLLLAPALRTLREAPAKRAQPPVPTAQALAALQAASDHLGSSARLVVTGERATLNLTGISPEALQAWLVEVRSAARARPVEAQLQRGAKGFNGSIVLALGNGVSP